MPKPSDGDRGSVGSRLTGAEAARAAEDRQDAELFRMAFYSGMRLGELVALRWRYVHFLPDLSGAVINVEHAVSAGVEKEPKGRRGRQVPAAGHSPARPARPRRRDKAAEEAAA